MSKMGIHGCFAMTSDRWRDTRSTAAARKVGVLKTLAMLCLLLLVLAPMVVLGATEQTTKENTGRPKHKKQTTKRARKDPAFQSVKDDPKLPRVLLIGDSISIGYTAPVRKALAGKANVHRIPVNGGNTQRGLDQLDTWLGSKPWDVIHFNFGLHDLKWLKGGKLDVNGEQVHSPEAYAANLDKLVQRLKKTDATLIWATTTPVPEGSAGRIAGDAARYNTAAAEVMARHGVRTNDLYAFVKPKLKEAQLPKNVHFTAKGSHLLGRQVAKEITSALKDR
ncbi:MAG: SGNH/GDSL hydrolase family protein [Pirellulales bacterium]|nr:SGNH/GDSL hydrolase family protein [Pirellulales bacterium]